MATIQETYKIRTLSEEEHKLLRQQHDEIIREAAEYGRLREQESLRELERWGNMWK